MVISSISAFMLLYGIIIFIVFIRTSIKSNSILKPFEKTDSAISFKKYIYVLIEIVTPIALIVSSALLFLKSDNGLKFSLFSLLALVYYSLRRFQWEGLSKDSRIMGTFIFIGFLGSSISMVLIMLKIY